MGESHVCCRLHHIGLVDECTGGLPAQLKRQNTPKKGNSLQTVPKSSALGQRGKKAKFEKKTGTKLSWMYFDLPRSVLETALDILIIDRNSLRFTRHDNDVIGFGRQIFHRHVFVRACERPH